MRAINRMRRELAFASQQVMDSIEPPHGNWGLSGVAPLNSLDPGKWRAGEPGAADLVRLWSWIH